MKADIDLRAARADLAAAPPITSDALFHRQQAIEKALKGLLTAHEISPARKHDLERLGELVIGVEGPDVATASSGLEEAVAVVRMVKGTIERLR